MVLRTIWISLLGKMVKEEYIAGLFLENLIKKHAREANISFTDEKTGEMVLYHCEITRRSDL